jgi:hypothetical protein
MNEEAVLSGEPLDVNERLLFTNLPKSTRTDFTWLAGEFAFEYLPVPRDTNYDRLYLLAKDAHSHDRQRNPASLDWEFAFAVFRLNRHPMWGILQKAGVNYRKPRWNGILWVIATVLFVVAGLAVVSFATLGDSSWARLQWMDFGPLCIFGAVGALLMFLWLLRIDRTQLLNEIERCRSRSQLVSSSLT